MRENRYKGRDIQPNREMLGLAASAVFKKDYLPLFNEGDEGYIKELEVKNKEIQSKINSTVLLRFYYIYSNLGSPFTL